mmetsp:Transcript_18920/g.28016  ORF Transcript_18920/g.28016 Transcript_18920/m.28016 type:complete len:419 (-) Transcript_18920:20-1276(-)|eukprot:CAMPEP_0194243920 /NCGR_PEP_ID=MMETSP0158-20130606/9764_1 /TAXON_ID=33649 /ORGANISM="Thalassionema nitzschioides, Strain L26-B" /LENGTH=418 /DNA_ID=CAMNT_0038979245 /DNA_START=67 /DNA_END=1323 /DNA_ORIENTATION=+
MIRFASCLSPATIRFTAGVRRSLSDVAAPIRRKVSLEERAALRAARKKRSQNIVQGDKASSSDSAGNALSAGRIKWVWYMSVILPTGIFAWAYNDENSPPAKLSKWIGLTGFITHYTDEISKPSHEKLLPDWNQMPNVPHDIPVPHTLVLDLEETLVSSTWDRKHGWRHAKRPGVDKFLHKMAQYYEIVLYSPSIDAIADPVVSSLDKSVCIMHRLYRDACHFKDGRYIKDLDRLNRNVNRMILLDDDEQAAEFNPNNLIRVKAYEDPTDRTDNTLERITPFLVELARKGHSDIPVILSQYRGMDADQIADEYQNRIENLRNKRLHNPSMLGGLVNRGAPALPEPEMTPVSEDDIVRPQQLTAKDLVGETPTPAGSGGMVQWMNRRAQEKEEQQMRKMEKWNEVMLKKQQEKAAADNK